MKSPTAMSGAGTDLSGGQADFTSSIKFLHAPQGHTQTSAFTRLTLAELVCMAESPRIGAKATAPCFSAHDGSAKTKQAALAAQFHVLILDFDDGDYNAASIQARLKDVAFLAWTSSSHTIEAPRWKIIIPLSRAIGATAWIPIAEGAALAYGADPAQARIQQVCYAPNRISEDASYEFINRLDGEPLDSTGSIAQSFVAAFEASREQVAAKATPKPQRAAKGSTDLISMVNQAYDVRSILEKNGYQRRGKKYLAPNSKSGFPGVHILAGDDGRERVFSHHSLESDPLADGHSHDAFDLVVMFRFHGNVNGAIKTLANELDPEGQAQRQRDYMAAQDATHSPAKEKEATRETAWPEYTPLASPRESVPYPMESLPPVLRDAVAEVCDYMQAPLPLIATSALTAVSACVQAHCDVARDAVLKSPTSLFSLILAESGERKTAVDGLFMKPIHDYDRHHAEIGFADKQAHNTAFEAWEIQHKALTANLAKAAKEGDTKTIEATQKAMEASASKEPKKARIPSLLIDDATPEAVMQSLVQAWPIGYLATSEGGSFFGGHGMKDESIMRNLAMFNSRWDGTPSKIQRSKAEPLEVSGVRLSACVMVQPHVLDSFMRTNGTVARGSGFLARFLVTWPESTQGSRQYKPPGAMPALTRLQYVMRDLLDNAPPLNAMNQVDTFTLELSAQGFEAWREVYNIIESNLAGHGEFSDIRDSASKAGDNVARIAAVFHSLEGRMGKIQADSMNAAAEVVLYHLRETQRLFDGVAVPEPVQHAKMLEEWILSRASVCVSTSANEILQFHPSGKLRKKDNRNAAIELLEEHGRARVVLDGRTKMIELNPAILEVTL